MDKASKKRSTIPTSLRLSPRAMRLWERLAEHLGLNKKDVIEVALRHLARHEGITEDDQAQKGGSV